MNALIPAVGLLLALASSAVTRLSPSPADIQTALPLMTPLERLEFAALTRALATTGGRPDVLKGTFPQQRAYIDDKAPFKASFCTRRAAKSFSVGLEYIHDSYDYPGAHYLFLMTVRSQAKRDFWQDVLKAIDRQYDLGIKFNESELIATMPNKAQIYVGGADSTGEEWRKMIAGKYRKVHIDEAQAFIHASLKDLVYEAFKPAVADYRGSIGLSGTPGMINKGLFFDVTRGVESGWSLHRWKTADNPYMAEKIAAEIEELKRLKPGVEKTPFFRRNYLGEWVIEDDALVYRYLAERNDFSGTLPFVDGPGRWHYVLAIDLGYADPSAFDLMAYHDSDPYLYGIEVFKQSGMDITAVAEKAKSYQVGRELDAMVIDGSNKQAVMEMSNRHGLHLLQPADKKGKADFIELMNSDYITGNIKLSPACAPLKEEYGALIWNDKSAKREEHPACENHASDAALYGWRFCYQYMSKKAPPRLRPGSPEWAKAQEQAMRARAARDVARMKEQQFGGDWGGGGDDDWGAG